MGMETGSEKKGNEIKASVTSLLFVNFTAANGNGDGSEKKGKNTETYGMTPTTTIQTRLYSNNANHAPASE